MKNKQIKLPLSSKHYTKPKTCKKRTLYFTDFKKNINVHFKLYTFIGTKKLCKKCSTASSSKDALQKHQNVSVEIKTSVMKFPTDKPFFYLKKFINRPHFTF